MKQLGIFKWSIAAAIAALVAALLYGGPSAAAIVAVLIALESSISFDNAVVNATVLRRMSRAWERAFLTIGIVIAVFGMRIVFPIVIVALATRLGVLEVVDQALHDKDAYADNVERAAPVIGAFGGTFLLLVSLSFFLDPEREVHWIAPVERRLAAAGGMRGLPTLIAAVAIVAASQLFPADLERDILLAGLVGLALYHLVNGLSELLAGRQGGEKATGSAGLAAFVYLEMLDASFSLDGVLGAFAITKDIVLVALGLGVGALVVRSLTVYLVRRGTLSEYRYLKHGAHWAIAGLSLVLFASIDVHVPEWLTAAVGLSAIIAAFVSSVAYNRRHEGG